MKLLHLELDAFGPFTDETLDLSAGSEGLHLIFGPNEAGKSSALRAVQQLLFGIPERTADAFVHPYDRLRIGGHLQHSDGRVLEFKRRKARSKSLQTADGKPCDPQTLARFLGGVERPLFASMFGINHESLVAGGEEILRGGGQLGQVLFAAGAGVANLRAVQERLRTEMDELFKPAGRIQKINKAVGELRDLQDAIKKQQLPSEDWERHDRNLRDAQRQKEELSARLDEQRREQRRLVRLRDALPALGRRRQLLAELENYRAVPRLGPDFSDKRRNAQTELTVAQQQEQQAQQELEKLSRKITDLVVDAPLLDETEHIEGLNRRLGEYRKALADRPRIDLMRKQAVHEAKEILRSLGRPADPEEAESLRLQVGESVAIQDLGQRCERLLANRDHALSQLRTVQASLERLHQEINAIEPERDLQALRTLAMQGQQQAVHEQEAADLMRELQRAERQAESALARLPLWQQSLQALLGAAVPSAETVDRFDADFKKLDAELQNLLRRVQEDDEAVAEIDNRTRQMELEHSVPSEDHLHEARKRRDAGWRLVRRAWLEQQEDTAEIALFAAEENNLPDAFERSVQQADEVSDRLRREADRVARKAALVGQREQHLQRRRQTQDALEQARSRRAALEAEWARVWAPLQVVPLSPLEMRAWLRQQAEIIRLAETCQDLRLRCTRLDDEIQRARAGLIDGLGADKNTSLAILIEQAKVILHRNDEAATRRRELARQIKEKEQEQRRLQTTQAEAEQELVRWREGWRQHMTRLGLGADASPAQANAVLAKIAELFQKLHEADGFRRRLDGIDRDVHDFTTEVAALLQRTAGELRPLTPLPQGERDNLTLTPLPQGERDNLTLTPLPLGERGNLTPTSLPQGERGWGEGQSEAAIEELYRRLKEANAFARERETLTAQCRRFQEQRDRARQTIQERSAFLEALCAEAGCASVPDLPAAEERSNRRRELETNLQHLHEQLEPLLVGQAFQPAGPLTPPPLPQGERGRGEGHTVDIDSLSEQINRLDEECGHLEQNRQELDRTIGALQNELERMDGNGLAAGAVEEAENLLAGIENNARQYTLLRMAAGLLQKGIERYRERNQGPVLARAGQLFADMTLGSFAGLAVDYNDRDEAIVTGIRGGQSVTVDGMSDGTRDQLYLALRLASLEAYLASHEPIPFIVDDILLNFDDDRSLAALNVLAELSTKTQVIFFTHHQHLVELARANLDDNVLFTHSLRARSAGVLFEMQ